MKEEIYKTLNSLNNYRFSLIRSEFDCVDDQEVDVISLDNKHIENYLEKSFMNGLLVDKRSENFPHIKFTKFCEGIELKEIDLVSDIFLFDKSRWFKIIKNIDLLTIIKKTHNTININALGISDKYILLLLHSIADKKKVSFKYYNELKFLRLNIDELILKEKISNYNISYNFFKSIENSFFSKSKILKQRQLLFLILTVKQPLRFFKGLINKIKKHVKTLKKRFFNFKVVVFMGVDGSGKTTTINELISIIGEDKCHYLHLGNKSKILPTTRLIQRFRKDSTSKVTEVKFVDSHKLKYNRNFTTRIKSIIFNTNLFLEVYINISWNIFKNKFFLKKEFILIDRYIYDRYKVNDSMLKYRLFPSPNLIFLLDASISTLLERKKEHPEITLKNFQNRYYKFLLNQDFSKVIRINSENSLANNTNLIIRLMNNE
jgi:thymidylate kinase